MSAYIYNARLPDGAALAITLPRKGFKFCMAIMRPDGPSVKSYHSTRESADKACVTHVHTWKGKPPNPAVVMELGKPSRPDKKSKEPNDRVYRVTNAAAVAHGQRI